jgi:hypothetical protein
MVIFGLILALTIGIENNIDHRKSTHTQVLEQICPEVDVEKRVAITAHSNLSLE